MTTVIAELIDDHNITVSADRGWEYNRIVIVKGVTGDGYQKVINAILDLNIPRIGSIIPGLNYPYLVLRSITALPMTTEDVRLRLYYSERATLEPVTGETAQITVGSMISQIETNQDADGNDISVSYTYPVDYTKREEYAGKTHEQGGMVSRLVPQRTFTIVKRFEFTANDIETLDDTYAGKINSDIWRGYDAETWLCLGILGQSNDGGQTYVVTASFQHNRKTWSSKVVFIDPSDGKPPVDLIEDVGKKDVTVYDKVPFSGINTIFGLT